MQEANYFSLRIPAKDSSPNTLFAAGLPLKKGQFFVQQNLQCSRNDNQPVIAALTPLAFWPDNSIKWLQVQGETPSSDVEKATFFVAEMRDIDLNQKQISPKVKITEEQITIAAGSSSVTVNTSKLFAGHINLDEQQYQFSVDYEFEAPFNSASPNLTDWHFTPYFDTASCKEAKVIDLVLHYQLKADSAALLPLEFTVVLKYFTHFGWADIQTTLCNPNPAEHEGGTWDLGEKRSVQIKDLSLKLQKTDAKVQIVTDMASADAAFEVNTSCKLWQRSSIGSQWNSPNHVNRDRRVSIHQPLSLVEIDGTSEEKPIRLSPQASLQGTDDTLQLTPQNFWQNFPTALSAQPEMLCWHLFHAEEEFAVELQPGEQKTHQCNIAFSAQQTYQKAEVCLTADWVAQCKVLPWFDKSLSDDPLQEIIELGLNGEQNFFAKRERIDEYGWRHFGDLYADHETAEYSGEDLFPSHYNNQYDPLYGFLKQWLLTADEKWKTLADNLARHIIDIDIYHCEQDKPEYNNGLFWHTDHYLPAETATHRTYSKHHTSDAYQDHAGGGGPGGQHCYTSGLQLYYFLTGCVQAKQTVLGLSEWITHVYEGDGTLFGLLLQFKNRYRKDLKQVATGTYPLDRGTANYMIALLDSYELTANRILLDKVAFIIKHTVSPQDNIATERHLDNVEECWFYTVFFQAVCRYLEIQQTVCIDENFAYAKACLLHYAQWMADNESPYLEKPDILEYPNQTWSAQELRKVQVLAVAADYATEQWAEKFKHKANELKQYIVNALMTSDEREYTRILALIMQNYGVDSVLQHSTKSTAEISLPTPSPIKRNAGWAHELKQVLKQFSVSYEWQQLQKRIPKLRGKQWKL